MNEEIGDFKSLTVERPLKRVGIDGFVFERCQLNIRIGMRQKTDGTKEQTQPRCIRIINIFAENIIQGQIGFLIVAGSGDREIIQVDRFFDDIGHLKRWRDEFVVQIGKRNIGRLEVGVRH